MLTHYPTLHSLTALSHLSSSDSVGGWGEDWPSKEEQECVESRLTLVAYGSQSGGSFRSEELQLCPCRLVVKNAGPAARLLGFKS